MGFKKIGLLFMVLILTFTMAACSEDSESTGGKVDKNSSATLTVWVHPFVGEDLKDKQKEVFDNMAASFKKEYPNVKVKFEEIPWANREQKLLTALAADQGPDVFYLIPDIMAQFADQGVLTPITDLLGDDWDKSDFEESSIESVTYKNEMYGLPILREVQTYIYNTKILKEIGGDPNNLPETWEEFDELAQKAKDKGYFGRSFEGGATANATLYPLVWQSGGDVISKDGKVLINNKDGLEAFERIQKWYKEDMIPKDSINTIDHFTPFVEGKIMAVWGAGLTVSSLKEKGFKDYVIGPPLKQEKMATFGTTGMFVVPSNSKHKELAAQLVAEMTSKESSEAFNSLTKFIPARKSATAIYDGDKDMAKMTEYVQYASPGVIHPVARVVMPTIQAELQAMMEGSKSPKEAADAVAKAIKDEMGK
ncbi:multiple sugar transport system substrate-binding protein [Fictibacillus halophilus]|uniref:Multiple sugar transport system substrate-binding protein n=1 Tax=Fictibacillus halophilus TaxID=1610490 RepID=A0ABV2LFS1_9BACL|nr:sugar ABC transporter substrate-binding protein [Fictibacillus halophilus]